MPWNDLNKQACDIFFKEKPERFFLGVAANLVKASAFKIFNFQLDLTLKDGKGGDISSFIPNGEWDLIGKINFLIDESFLNAWPLYFKSNHIFFKEKTKIQQ